MAVAIVAALGWIVFTSGERKAQTANAGITLPELNATAAEGAALFARFCAECHGDKAGGSDKGPPLVHNYYRPDHHPDQAFLVATLYGARQHHWQFGNMQPVEGISEDQVVSIIAFVRAVQRANGIE